MPGTTCAQDMLNQPTQILQHPTVYDVQWEGVFLAMQWSHADSLEVLLHNQLFVIEEWI